MKRTSTYFAKAGDVPDNWRVIDATGISLGRLARQVAVALQGKDQPTYTPHVITGSHVVVINADKVRITGRKLMQKMYYRHSGYVGNLKSFLMRDTGPLLWRALMSQDLYLAASMIMILSSLTLIGTLISDILLAWVDPRIRYGERGTT